MELGDNYIIVERDTSNDDIPYCNRDGKGCTDIFGNRVKMKLSQSQLCCKGCGNKIPVTTINDKGARWYQIMNEDDERHVSIVRRSKDEDEAVLLSMLKNIR
jgi:hypothetical protein